MSEEPCPFGPEVATPAPRATLDPQNRLITTWRILEPHKANQPVWQSVLELRLNPAPYGGGRVRPLVFANGSDRPAAMVNGARRAVRCYALNPAGPRPLVGRTALGSDLDGRVLLPAQAELADPVVEKMPMVWYTGTTLESNEPIWVPHALVDHPVTPLVETSFFDSGPWGAGVGRGWDAALREALFEAIANDAAMIAWAARLNLPLADLDAITQTNSPEPWTHQLGEVVGRVKSIALTPLVLPLPTALAGLHCAAVFLIDRLKGRTLAAAGTAASPFRSQAVLEALLQALKSRSVLIGLHDHSTVSTQPVVTSALQRARLWTMPEAVEGLESWLGRLPSRRWESVKSGWSSSVPTVALLRTLRTEAPEGAVVDLTSRLPEAHRRLGWRVARIVVPDLQPLRTDETHSFTWRQHRITAAARLHGHHLPLGAKRDDSPHPWI